MNLNQSKIFWTLIFMVLGIQTSAGSEKHIYSNLKIDETIQFITGAAWLDEAAGVWNVPVRVWVFELENSRVRKKLIATTLNKKYGLSVTEKTQENFDRRVNYIIADNERGKKIVIEIAGKTWLLNKTDPRGHSETLIQLPVSEVPAGQALIEYRAILPEKDVRQFVGHSLLILPQGVSILSDIDDTVKISEVTDHAKLFDNTFYQDFIAVPGMSEIYNHLAKQGASLHFVSSSPWQLYPELNAFLDREAFPARSLSLKTVRFKDRSFFNLFKSGDETKPEQIEPLFQRFPKRQFILIGDSGEEDAKVYSYFLGKYPDQVKAAFIRELDSDQTADSGGNKFPGKLFYFNEPQEILKHLVI